MTTFEAVHPVFGDVEISVLNYTPAFDDQPMSIQFCVVPCVPILDNWVEARYLEHLKDKSAAA